MPTFDFLPLLWWGLPLAAAPVVIHLINLLRHRRVPWAAMEFLLASQKRYRTRVLLKQILLLLLRVAAVLGVVLAMAQPRWTSALGQLLGGARTTHVVLLDDSYSMSDRTGEAGGEEATAFDRGRQVVERICSELAAASGVQELAVGRFSRLAAADPSGAAAPKFDIPRRTATPTVMQQIRDELATWAPSAHDTGPREPVTAAAELFGAGSGAKSARVVWLVSDFRAGQWKSADDTAALLRELTAEGAEIRLVDCALDATAGAQGGRPSGNLTIERLEVAGGVPATGVLVPLEVAVRNQSDRPVADVAVTLREDGAERPGVRIQQIPAGGVATQRIGVRFPQTGSHVVEARIPADAVAVDNTRTAVIDVVDRVDVLLIDGALGAAGEVRAAARTGDAFYLAAALAPGAGATTGLRPRVEPSRSLTTLDLKSFDCIWLLDVERLDPAEVAALEAFASGGGGVVFFVGPRTKPELVNRSLVRDGKGLFPVPLAGAVDLLPDAAAQAPDVVVEEHPVVAVLAGQRNPLLDAVRIDRYMAVQRGSETAVEGGLRRLLSLRTGAPLVLERAFGAGMVVVVLTTAAPEWNTWARGNPSWVVVMLELESHLASARRKAESLEVGAAVRLPLDAAVDGIEVDFVIPPDGTVVHQTAAADPAGSLAARLPAADAPGAYAARWQRADGTQRERLFAVNVAPDEGRLERIGRERLDRTLAGVPFTYENAAALQPDTQSLAGVSLVTPLLLGLLGVLLLEQLVAYSSSYHPAVRQPRSA